MGSAKDPLGASRLAGGHKSPESWEQHRSLPPAQAAVDGGFIEGLARKTLSPPPPKKALYCTQKSYFADKIGPPP